MTTVYKTKRDINGNTYWLILDHARCTYRDDFAIVIGGPDPIIVGKRDLQRIKADAIAAGYSHKV